MKKMLTIIGALGLVATTGNTVVSCSLFNKDNKNDNAFLQLNTYEIHLARRTLGKFGSETLEILDYDKKTEEFQKIIKDYLKDHQIKIPLENKIGVSVELHHVSGITNINHKILTDNEEGNHNGLIAFSSKETRGKSTWSLTLSAEVTDKNGKNHILGFTDNAAYFDVFVD